MQNAYKAASAPAPVSFTEESAWNEFIGNPGLFFKRGAVLTTDLPRGAGLEHARDILTNVSARHDVFRTAFETTAGRPARYVLPAHKHKIMEADAAVYPLMGESATSLSPDDLARVWLTPGPDGTKRLSIDINEMITDSWSCARLQAELAALAEAYGSAMPGLSTPPAAYSDFAREQRGRQLHGELAAYWSNQLKDMAPYAYITRDGPDPSGDVAGERVVIFSDDMTESLRAVCRQRKLSPFMAVVALVNTVLAARSGARDIVLSTTTGTRAGKWTDVQGNFSNVLLLRTVLPTNPSFADVLSLSRAGVLGALTHQTLPYLQLTEVVGAEIAQPPVRVHFLPHRAHHYRLLDSRPSGDAWIEDAVFAGWPMEIGFAEDRRNRFAIWMSYDPKLYLHASAGKLLEACCDVLRLACANPELTCADLSERTGLEDAGRSVVRG